MDNILRVDYSSSEEFLSAEEEAAPPEVELAPPEVEEGTEGPKGEGNWSEFPFYGESDTIQGMGEEASEPEGEVLGEGTQDPEEELASSEEDGGWSFKPVIRMGPPQFILDMPVVSGDDPVIPAPRITRTAPLETDPESVRPFLGWGAFRAPQRPVEEVVEATPPVPFQGAPFPPNSEEKEAPGKDRKPRRRRRSGRRRRSAASASPSTSGQPSGPRLNLQPGPKVSVQPPERFSARSWEEPSCQLAGRGLASLTGERGSRAQSLGPLPYIPAGAEGGFVPLERFSARGTASSAERRRVPSLASEQGASSSPFEPARNKGVRYRNCDLCPDVDRHPRRHALAVHLNLLVNVEGGCLACGVGENNREQLTQRHPDHEGSPDDGWDQWVRDLVRMLCAQAHDCGVPDVLGLLALIVEGRHYPARAVEAPRPFSPRETLVAEAINDFLGDDGQPSSLLQTLSS
ncbi:uncharacterized protein LOC110448731 [Mizuhopecten yessoensis]|uniref:uncharacterized protein LOC110448731 n=1 Tax=Mizuhopecten yessoensis TaxID=6573 RepID=UPI000B45C3E1|nr:uncharacterized protein LOC110448731 [Mizuhopecten yessoensis]